jgi:hypothetical protein
MKELSHSDLCNIGARWISKKGLPLAAVELKTIGREIPDVYATNGMMSAIMEAKVSRSDFLADAKKEHRMHPYRGIGDLRYYICPEGLIKPDEVPSGWGLIWVSQKGRIIEQIPLFKGNIPSECSMRHPCDKQKDRDILYSICRRFIQGKADKLNVRYR